MLESKLWKSKNKNQSTIFLNCKEDNFFNFEFCMIKLYLRVLYDWTI